MRVKDILEEREMRRVRYFINKGRLSSWVDADGYLCYDEFEPLKKVKMGRPLKRGKHNVKG